MKSISNARSKNGVLFSVMSLLMISTFSTAFAQESNSPGASTIPDPISQGGVTNISFKESDKAPHGSMEGIYVFDPNNVPIDNNAFICPMPVTNVGMYWVLLKVGGTTLADEINYWIPDTVADNAKVSVPFGGGVAVVITPSNGAKVGTGLPPANGVGFGQTTALAAEWHKLSLTPTQGTQTPAATANTDSTITLGTYTAVSCGNEGPTFAAKYQTPVNFDVIHVVGGEIISINTSALLIAGITSSGLWMIPTLGAVVGTGISLYKIRRHN